MERVDGAGLEPVRITLPLYGSLHTRLRAGHDIALLESGDAFFSALVEAIDAARETVFLETYIFHDDASGRRVARALAAAFGRGVRVHVVVDGYGTGSIAGEAGALLSACPGVLEVFRPERGARLFDRQRLRRLHRKLAVVDSSVAFVGGINILDDHVDPNHGVLDAPRFDFAVRVRGPLVAHVNVIARRLWHEVKIVNGSLRRRAAGSAGASSSGGEARVRTRDLLHQA